MTRGRVAWFTGLSGSGKSTIAELAAAMLRARGLRVAVLDGDAVRERLHRHLGFSPSDIRENNRLVAGLCVDTLADHDVVLVPIIAPFRDARAEARRVIGDAFLEIHVRASLPELMRRDPKGLYRAAQAGTMTGLIGVAPEVPYEPPDQPDLVLDTERQDARACADALVGLLLRADPDTPIRDKRV